MILIELTLNRILNQDQGGVLRISFSVHIGLCWTLDVEEDEQTCSQHDKANRQSVGRFSVPKRYLESPKPEIKNPKLNRQESPSRSMLQMIYKIHHHRKELRRHSSFRWALLERL